MYPGTLILFITTVTCRGPLKRTPEQVSDPSYVGQDRLVLLEMFSYGYLFRIIRVFVTPGHVLVPGRGVF